MPMTGPLRRVLVVAAGVLVCLGMVALGLWQMDVFRAQGRASAAELTAMAPVPLTEHLEGTDAGSVFGRQVILTGEFLGEHQITVGTSYPVRVATAFRLSDGTHVAVVRGQIGKGGTASPAPTGRVSVTGILLPSENEPDRSTPAPGLPEGTVPRLRLATVAQRWPSPLVNGYVTLNAEDATAQHMTPATVVLPELEGSARNGGYALQWWVFAAAALVFSVLVARSIKDPETADSHPADAGSVSDTDAAAADSSGPDR